MRRWALAVALLFVPACLPEEEELGDRTCPPGGTKLSYEGFGKPFMERWCIHCHGGPNGYSGRAFTTVESIRVNARRIYVNAAGPNVSMPPGPDDPSEAEREQLAEWLTCGAP